ncbi:MAG: outer membrane lipid asymmetry maintenance protein MlaD [Desulfobacteraceae bacterium]|nr:outer membrane lipid asymmetry maintenance protein MlaD [Desulfobacteraceae bacterium]
MKNKKTEFYVGVFIVIGIMCSAYLIFTLGEFKFFNNDRYSVYAYFTSVSGLSTGADVEMAGVAIGKVVSISLDSERLLAKVELSIIKNIELSEDVIASVKTTGIIGDKYIELSPGGSEIILKPDDIIYNTESSVDLESLVRKFIFNAKNE